MMEPLYGLEAERLRQAAAVLREWRDAKPYFPRPEPTPGWDLGLETPSGDAAKQARGDT